MTRPLILLIRGIPGSGKSKLAEQLRSALADAAVSLLDPDEVDTRSLDYIGAAENMRAMGVPAEIHVYRYLCERARHATARDDLIIWNQPFTNRGVFRSLLRVIDSFPQKPYVAVVELGIDPALAFDRVSRRAAAGGREVPQWRFDQFVADYESYADLGRPTLRMTSQEVSGVAVLELAEFVRRMIGVRPAFAGTSEGVGCDVLEY